MPAPDYESMSDEDLVAIIQSAAPGDKAKAVGLLAARVEGLFRSIFAKNVKGEKSFLRATGFGRYEDFCVAVLGDAIRSYRPGLGAKFSTFLFTVFQNRVIEGCRKKEGKREVRMIAEPSGDVPPDDEEQPRPRAGSRKEQALFHACDAMALREVRDIFLGCLRTLSEPRQKIYVWCQVFGHEPSDLREVLSGMSIDKIKQDKHRARVDFMKAWVERGGERAEYNLEAAAAAMAVKTFDLSRIRDPRAREAYDLWRRNGFRVGKVTGQMKLAEADVRDLLLKALHDLFSQVFRKAGKTDWKAVFRQEEMLVRYLQLAEEGKPAAPAGEEPARVLDRFEHTENVIRAAFGLVPLEAAVHSLGSFLQSRLATEEDYDRACDELSLKPADLRRLLAGSYEPKEAFYSRLSKFLGEPEDRLRVLPLQSVEADAPALRSRAVFDTKLFRRKVQECLAPRK